VLRALHGGRLDARAVVVVAHPDDETVSLGGLLGRMADLTLVHVTDGAPEDMSDARRLGFQDRTAYRDARAAELAEALRRLSLSPRRRSFGLPDQDAVEALALLARELQPSLDGAEIVVTHAYEGGHPDHDSCAFAVQAACTLLRRAGRAAPVRLEFPSYHASSGGRVVGRFHPGGAGPEQVYLLRDAEFAAKQAAVAAFATQAEVTAWFIDPGQERLRPAPDYDFTAPPPCGEALYDGWGWTLTSATWRERASAALRELRLLKAAG
jgi:LmbE family N-acetylglucosaminyl deacetylase